MATWNYSKPLESKSTLCDECECNLIKSDNPPAEVTLYTRNGTKFAQHFSKVCPNRWCRKVFGYGYTVKRESKVYEDLAQYSFLLSSNDTGFAIEYLYEATLHVLHSNASFQGLANVYNQLHNYERKEITRENLCDKRLASGFFLYSCLEMSARYKVNATLYSTVNSIDDLLLTNQANLKSAFSRHWSGAHDCAFKDCEKMMITDGNMKLVRKVCAARYSVVRQFEHTDKTVLTGCTSMPIPNSPYCSEHIGIESPVLLSEKISKETKKKLVSFKAKNNSSNLKLPNDSVFVVESVLDSRKSGSSFEYLVKFVGYPENEACWESIHHMDESTIGLEL